ncbi:MAG: hypothetical protein ABIA63_00495 [bacterium]
MENICNKADCKDLQDKPHNPNLKNPIKALCLITFFCLFNSPLFASDDPWFGIDKAQHFAVSVVAAAGSKYMLHTHSRLNHTNAAAVGAGFTITLGISKEVYDKKKGSYFSCKDLIYDILGTAAGIWLVWP